MLQLFILGTHGAFCDAADEFHTGALVTDGNSSYLIDAGSTVIRALAAAEMKPDIVDGVFVTHVHGDHVGGLEELAFRKYYLQKKKLHVVAPDDIWEDLHCYLDMGLTPFNTWDGGISHRLSEIIDISRIPMAKDGRSLPFCPDMDSAMEFHSEPVLHIPGKSCCAYTVRDIRTGNSFWWSGDMVFQKEILASVADNEAVKAMFVDCHPKPAWPGTVHCHIDQLQTLPDKAQEKIHPIHYGSDAGALPSSGNALLPAAAGVLYRF